MQSEKVKSDQIKEQKNAKLAWNNLSKNMCHTSGYEQGCYNKIIKSLLMSRLTRSFDVTKQSKALIRMLQNPDRISALGHSTKYGLKRNIFK